jgi:hypothetical protein
MGRRKQLTCSGSAVGFTNPGTTFACDASSRSDCLNSPRTVRRFARTRRRLLQNCVVALLVAPIASHASTVLVGAPTSGDASWDTQSNIPPSGAITFFADQFSLSGSESVAAITAQLGGVSTSPSIFELQLVTSVTSITPLYSASFASAPFTTFSLPINATLGAGTYYLQLETTGFMGWAASDGNYVTTDGTVSDGIWQDNRAGSLGWIFAGSEYGHAGVFSVVSSVPLPPSAWLLLSGLVGVMWSCAARREALSATLGPARHNTLRWVFARFGLGTQLARALQILHQRRSQ